MKIQKRKLAYAIMASALMLGGCSTHSNPLNQYSHRSVAQDLLASAVSVEMRLGLAKHRYQSGYQYLGCMDGEKSKANCEQIYQLMSKQLKKKYKGLTVSDIQDQKMWSSVKEYYQREAFERLPEP